MELQIGDRLADETGEWEVVVGRPFTTAGRKNAHVRLHRLFGCRGTEGLAQSVVNRCCTAT
jgi:hypothetical protein